MATHRKHDHPDHTPNTSRAADAYSRTRKSGPIRWSDSDPIVIGLGTGRCGTKSAARLLGITHEIGAPLPWVFSEAALRQRIAEIRHQPGPIIGDVAFYYLNYVTAIDQAENCRFICMQRSRHEVVASYSRHVGNRNHWMHHSGCQWQHDARWDPAYPVFDGVSDREEAIGLYWDSYNKEAKQLETTMPNFYIFDIEQLNTPIGRGQILEAAGIVDSNCSSKSVDQ